MFFPKANLFEWTKSGLSYALRSPRHISLVRLRDNRPRWLYDDVDKGLDKPSISKVSNDLELTLNNKRMLEKVPIFLTTFSTKQNIFLNSHSAKVLNFLATFSPLRNHFINYCLCSLGTRKKKVNKSVCQVVHLVAWNDLI